MIAREGSKRFAGGTHHTMCADCFEREFLRDTSLDWKPTADEILDLEFEGIKTELRKAKLRI